MKSSSDCLFFRTSTHIEVLFSWRDAITWNVLFREFINDDPDLLEDVVCLLLGYDDPLSLSHLEALGDQEVSHLTGTRGLKHLPEVTVIRTRMSFVISDLRERSVRVDMGLTARLYSSLHQICFLIGQQ